MEKMGVMEPMEWTAKMAQTELQVQLVRNHWLNSEKSIELLNLFSMSGPPGTNGKDGQDGQDGQPGVAGPPGVFSI